MSASRVRLWLIRKTEKAYLFQTAFRPGGREVWVPRSIVEHISWESERKDQPFREAEVTLPEWFISKNEL